MEAEHWDARYSSTDLVWSAGPNLFVEEELSYLSPGRALDLACGEGRNALWLAQRGWDVTAVDFSKVAIEKGRNIERMRRTSAEGVASTFGHVDWKVADATTFTSDEEFDVALLCYLQVGSEKRRAAVRAAYATLRRGGILLVVAHDSTNLTEGTGGPQDPAMLYTAEDVLDDLKGESFSVSKAERVKRPLPGDKNAGEPDRVAWDALVRLTRE